MISLLELPVISISLSKKQTLPPPIVYTIAGSDSGGGAGIQADLRAINAMGGHACTAITCLTAQSSMGVSKNGIHAPPSSFLREQLDVLVKDLFPRAVKVGMLGTAELAIEVGGFLKEIKSSSTFDEPPFVVVDPVMVSTSGSRLIGDGVMEAMIKNVFPYADILTPNKFEAEALLGKKLLTYKDIELGKMKQNNSAKIHKSFSGIILSYSKIFQHSRSERNTRNGCQSGLNQRWALVERII